MTTISSLASSTSTSSTTSSSGTTLDSDAFLQLLIAELQNQDPTNPADNTEMINQIASFSTVEQLSALNDTATSIYDSLTAMSLNSAVSFIGQSVLAEGDDISKTDDATTSVSFTLESDAETLTAHVYDSDGTIINSVSLGATDSGTYTFSWDGTNYTGTEVANGTYSVVFEAYDEDGDSLEVSTMVAGTVSGVSVEDGTTVLTLSDGRTVNLEDVYSVVSSDA
ncbi:flagellar hook capping FlgD N-terminal domain-containing protein [Nitratidesulfovibrio liaohensis]|uniref:Basal-body rod modification protein FlgD n=1 Tax=Nitratidesulfovibrio liaohensis TaxID=2604158 RepID=A0ABY9QWP8_9BACT|nr:flagellar hook capping FlgD N-terminal domain-containing protein [Nitratidesulfovibrio liaohensis]WMW63939.1 flagellar hook capping protein [Nitratidesulfovibrio liaohensis]